MQGLEPHLDIRLHPNAPGNRTFPFASARHYYPTAANHDRTTLFCDGTLL